MKHNLALTWLLWHVALTRLLWQIALTGCFHKVTLTGCSDRLLWQDALTGCSDRLLWQVALTGCSDRLLCQADPIQSSTSTNFIWLPLTTFSTVDLQNLVGTNPGGHTTLILYECKSVHLVYTTLSTAVVGELWENYHTTLSPKDLQYFTAILCISLLKFYL